jgi:L-aminopeptidase/D-esterase-like protein
MDEAKSPALIDVPGIQVGHAHDEEAITGCTVVLTAAGAVCGVDVRGGAPGTRETDLLNPVASISEVHSVLLSGGSAFGAAAATGVMDWLLEHDIGYHIQVTRVPLVPAAVILDLAIGRADRWPDARMGYDACANAHTATTVAEGSVGVGMGATVGKIEGIKAAMKGGVGTWAEMLADGTIIGAMAVCNAFGDVYDEAGNILAGVRDLEQGGFANAMHLMRQEKTLRALKRWRRVPNEAISNTTLAVVATDARLTKTEATKMAQMAQDGLSRTIRPVHTPFDGDTVFALSTGQREAPALAVLGSVAADVLARAIERCVTQATTMGGILALRDLQPS